MTVLLNLRWHYKKDGNSLICTLGVQEISILVENYTHRITLQEKKTSNSCVRKTITQFISLSNNYVINSVLIYNIYVTIINGEVKIPSVVKHHFI